MSMGDMKSALRSSLLDQNIKTYTRSGYGKEEESPRNATTSIDLGNQPFGKPRPQSNVSSPKKSTGNGTK